jgi:hypothetical protein
VGKIEDHFLAIRRGNIGNLNLVVRNVGLALKGPESTTSDGIFFS